MGCGWEIWCRVGCGSLGEWKLANNGKEEVIFMGYVEGCVCMDKGCVRVSGGVMGVRGREACVCVKGKMKVFG